VRVRDAHVYFMLVVHMFSVPQWQGMLEFRMRPSLHASPELCARIAAYTTIPMSSVTTRHMAPPAVKPIAPTPGGGGDTSGGGGAAGGGGRGGKGGGKGVGRGGGKIGGTRGGYAGRGGGRGTKRPLEGGGGDEEGGGSDDEGSRRGRAAVRVTTTKTAEVCRHRCNGVFNEMLLMQLWLV
jgi:hypothetical protein